MPKKILLVEDETIIAMAEAQMLKKHGYEVVTVNNGEKAVAAADSDPDISLILMDIDLGKGIDGTEAAERILTAHDLPIAFLSSHIEPEVVAKTEGITSYGYIAKNSGEMVLLASIKMALRLYEAHLELKAQKQNLNTALTQYEQTAEELYEREGMLRNLMENSIDAVHLLNEDGKFLDINKTACKMTGYTSDLTDRKQQEEELVAHENLLMTLINNIPDAIFYKNLEGRYLLVNNAKVKQLEVHSKEEVIGKTVHDFFPKKQADIFMETERQYLETEMPPHSWEEQVETLGGGHVWHFNTKVLVRDLDNNPLGLLTICRDITKEKSSEANIKGLLEKNELLLKETHHRVKNNLNTILSLLALQADSGETPEVREKLQDAAGRVRSMTVLYDKLYRSDTFSELGITDFLPPLIDEIVGVFPSVPPVRTDVLVEEMVLSSKILSPLGIILNELITNSMKYAFKGRDSGVIAVTATRKEGLVTIVYEDNGVGLPESVDVESSGGFGMQLIHLLTKQIGGTVRIERRAGTKYVIEVEC